MIPQTLLFLPLLLSSLTLTLAAAPTSFCKCTCFSNSTIIPLGGQPPSSTPTSPSHLLFPRSPLSPSIPPPSPDNNKKTTGGSCTTCNRQFCLSYNLPICKGAKEEDVFTTCFQRDSRKDEAVVFIFIVATGGLLIWAGVRGWVGGWMEAMRERRSYIPISNQDG